MGEKVVRRSARAARRYGLGAEGRQGRFGCARILVRQAGEPAGLGGRQGGCRALEEGPHDVRRPGGSGDGKTAGGLAGPQERRGFGGSLQ